MTPEKKILYNTTKRERRRLFGHERRKVTASEYGAAFKESAINMYSNGEATCAWCPQGDIDVLCLDHLANDGNKFRQETRAWNIYKWARDHDYPPIFQVLCFNCNMKKRALRYRGQPTTKEEALK